MGMFICEGVIMSSCGNFLKYINKNIIFKRRFKINDWLYSLLVLCCAQKSKEIVICIVEVIINEFCFNKIGFNIILSSSAYLLLINQAICIISIPKNKVKPIHNSHFIGITFIFNTISFLSLIIFFNVHTKSEVNIGESSFFIVLIPLLFLFIGISNIKKKIFPKSKFMHSIYYQRYKQDIRLNKWEEIILKCIKEFPDIPVENLGAIIISYFKNTVYDPLKYIKMVIPYKLESHESQFQMENNISHIYSLMKGKLENVTQYNNVLTYKDLIKKIKNISIINFSNKQVNVKIGQKLITIQLKRLMNNAGKSIIAIDEPDKCNYTFKNAIKFAPKEKTKLIKLIRKEKCECHDFKIYLSLISNKKKNTIIGHNNKLTIHFETAPSNGIFEFQRIFQFFKKTKKHINFTILRNNTKRKEWIKWEMITIDDVSHDKIIGCCVFHPFDENKRVFVDITEFKKYFYFLITLTQVSVGCSIGCRKYTTIVRLNDVKLYSKKYNILKHANLAFDHLNKTSLLDNMKKSCIINGNNSGTIRGVDYCIHFFSFYWKVLFSTIIPITYTEGLLQATLGFLYMAVLSIFMIHTIYMLSFLVGVHPVLISITIVQILLNTPHICSNRLNCINELNADLAIGNSYACSTISLLFGVGTSWMISTIYWNIKVNALL
ncbi:hypothetical protein A3Q56_00199 [Intoshia linei]|uniref:Uncharacterized protein n=1 Tax=Intoshia linei TaxID=1819745 RepID=A0A177BCI0_9BILA|nr:hypothetical protein A3Q56_00199 [Intoshia linei]